MEQIIKIFQNFKGGPMSTLLGCVFMVLGGKMLYDLESITYTSPELGLLIIGAYFWMISDEWIKDLFK